MLRQLYMTLNFYQVNYTFSLFNSNSFNFLQNPNIINLSYSSFTLFPYIKPTSPFLTPPPSVMKAARHIRRKALYDDLSKLNSRQIKEFLQAYRDFKHPQLGHSNPTDVSNPFYQWVIKYKVDAWTIQKVIIDNYDYDKRVELLPLWCQARMGQSQTVLPDGRVILIGGEYEDYYHPDFCIYNDVSIINTNGTIETYNYSKTIFTPTDFHTATLVSSGDNEYIIIVGSLGYLEDRQYCHTPVYRLNTQNFKIEQVATRNSMGWIHKHDAMVKDNQIIVTGGQLLINDVAPLLDNVDTWVLNLNTLVWKNSTHRDRKWQRFYIKRQDESCLSLWYYQQLDKHLQTDFENISPKNIVYIREHIQKYLADIEAFTNQVPDLDSYRQLLIPPLEHETYIDGHIINYDHVLFIDGIKVGYKTANDACIQVIIEGKLSEDKLELLQQNLRHKLSKIENMACEVVEI